MDNHIKALQLPPSLNEHYGIIPADPKRGNNTLSGLSHINVFVGSNNSGKSRLLRGIASVPKLFFKPPFIDTIIQASTDIKNKFRILYGLNNNFSSQADNLPNNYDLIEEGSNTLGKLRELVNQMHEIKKLSHINSRERHIDALEEMGIQLRKTVGHVLESFPDRQPLERLYLPTLRGLRTFTSNQDAYRERTAKDYFKAAQNVEIFTGLKFYDELQDLLLGDGSQRRLVREFENFLSDTIFDGNSVTLMPRKGSDVVWVRIGREAERPVHDLGDGVQHLIILTFPLFKNRHKRSLVFVEEPELFLHPGMQRSLVKAMLKFPEYQYFIATHSNHILDLTIEMEDISIYMVRKALDENHVGDEAPAKFEIEVASTHDHRLLELLGSRVSSVFLSNCTVWVEGITDRRYIAHFLELYVQHLKDLAGGAKIFTPRQDLHFSFVEYSGGNITHWSFLDRTPDPIEVTRLCSRLMLIADKDGNPWKTERQDELRAHLQDRFVVLDCREVENLLTAEVLRKVLVSYGEDVTEIKPLSQHEYATRHLGKYLNSKIANPKRKGGYAEVSGTIKNKMDFCAKAISHMRTYKDLSEAAQTLIGKVYSFITQHN